MLLLRTLAGLVRAKVASRNKNVDRLVVETRNAMQRSDPVERLVLLTRLIVDAKFQEKREPRRARVLHATLLDLTLDSLMTWRRRDPQLAEAHDQSIAEFERQRAELESDDEFEREVEALRTSVRR